MATQKLKKNLPKRCTNERLKARRAASWQQGQEGKARRRSAQESRERANRSNKGPTPHEAAKARAREHRVPVHREDEIVFARTNTSYDQIRRNMTSAYAGLPGVTESYLDEVHRRWTAIGKKLRGGAL